MKIARSLVLIFFAATLLQGSTLAETPRPQSKDLQESVRPGINDRFLTSDLDVEQWVGRFEVESREVYSARDEVLQASGIRPGQRVADIGAGTGLYTRLFSEQAGTGGWVFAVDIAPRFLEHINRESAEFGQSNVTAVLGQENSVPLPPGSIDVAFICDTYHHFEFPEPTMHSLHQALVPGGTLIVIDFERIPGESREWTLGHVRAGKEVFRREIEAAGFELLEEKKISGFRENYFLKFIRK